MKERLDDVDYSILKLLQEDGRISNADLARRIGLSPPSVLQRVRKLEDQGFIEGYSAKLCPEKLGLDVTVFAHVSLVLHQDQPIEAFRHAVQDVPEIVECFHVSGEYDFLLKLVVPDIQGYERLIREKLSTMPGVGRLHSCFVFATTKHSNCLPIP